MDSTTSNPIRSHPWRCVALVAALLLAFLAFKIVSIFYVGHEVRALRESIREVRATPWQRKIELSAGAISVNSARLVLAFTKVPPEARTAARALKDVEVGVYEGPAGECPPSPADVFRAADAAMAQRGWDRMAGVVDRDQSVLVYTPNGAQSPRSVRLAVAVIEPRQAVVVCARGNLEPLLELAQSLARKERSERRPWLLSAALK